MSGPALVARDLSVEITGRDGVTPVLDGVGLELRRGRMHGLVGETGSGKSMTARSVIGLLPPGGRITAGSVQLGGRELLGLDADELRELRGASIGMVFQNPRTALYPMMTIETQMANVLKAHLDLDRRGRAARIRERLRLVGIDDVDRIARSYPHELSGGLAQRAVIATALLCDPEVLIADEPTTGLDATIQRQILELIAFLQSELSLSVLIITHDLGIIAQYCDTVSVMHDGRVVEDGDMRGVLLSPQHDYTKRLIAASDLRGLHAQRVQDAGR
ncbi:MAG: ABC transporter ATP-binding protein [bacterium]|nr:ABC transporter ATP-binding protein [bacterium]